MFLFLELTFPYLLSALIGAFVGYSIPKPSDGDGHKQ